MIAQLGYWVSTVAAATTPPTPTVEPWKLEANSPGPGGFFATLFVALVVVVLAYDMIRRVRRATYKAEIQERLEAEKAEAEAAAAAEAEGMVPEAVKPEENAAAIADTAPADNEHPRA